MDVIILILCLLVTIPLLILSNRLKRKYRNTKVLLILQFSWFIVTAAAFLFFFTPNFNRAQNIVMGAFIGGGMVYYFYKFRAIKQNSGH
jgi:uncharacterized membrane protein